MTNNCACVYENGHFTEKCGAHQAELLKNVQFNMLTPAEHERLSIMAEECAEVIVAIGKILRHGYESSDPHSKDDPVFPTTNRCALERELGDVLYSMRSMIVRNDINESRIEEFSEVKKTKILPWLHSQPKGTT